MLLTLFSASLQYVDNYNLVAQVFDLIMLEGWRGFFKFFIFLFKKLERKLLKMEYDKVLEFLNK